ncbi:MAG: hypothetical protein ABI759_07935 [Candidatus Solibacter sp.]
MNDLQEARNTAFRSEQAFRMLVRHVFSLDPKIRWLAVEEAARAPKWAWREDDRIYRATTGQPAELVDPLLFLIADAGCEGSSTSSSEPGRLRFAVLAYRDLVQVVARYEPGSHITVAADPDVDAYRLGTRLSEFLTRCMPALAVN